MKIDRIDHFHIFVKDLEGAIELFSSIMGTKFIGPIDRRPKRTVRVAFDNYGLELCSPTSPEDPIAKHIEEHGEGLAAIALKVENHEEAVAEMEARGIKCIRRGTGKDVKAAVFSQENTYGVTLELIEYDVVQPITLANLEKLDEFPWYGGYKNIKFNDENK